MPEPGLITRYQAELAAQLPAQIVDELADGLCETYQHYLGQGLAADAAAEAAIAEFGEPQLILAAFTRDSPARRAARRLLATGPAVGGCWAAALITGRAWTWPSPVEARTVFAATLITAVGLLTAAALGRRYRTVRRATAAGCAAAAALDTAMLVFVTLAVPAITWPLILAATVSAARIALTSTTLRPMLITRG